MQKVQKNAKKLQLPTKLPYKYSNCIKKIWRLRRRYENVLKMQLLTLWLALSFAEDASRCKKKCIEMQLGQNQKCKKKAKNTSCIFSPLLPIHMDGRIPSGPS